MDKIDIGALWKRTAKSGVQYMSGSLSINGIAIEIVVFSNKKTKDNHPDFRIYQSEPPQKQETQDSPAPSVSASSVPAPSSAAPSGADEIPF